MSRWFVALLTLAGCPAEPQEEDVTGVMRDCEAAPGRICPWAGAGIGGYNGDGLDRHETYFSFPMSATISPYGPVVVADWNNHKIRRLNADGTFTTIMGTDFLGDGDAALLDATPDGALGTTVNLNHPTRQEYFEDGTLLSASWHTHKLRTWDPNSDKVHVILGRGPGYAGDDVDADEDGEVDPGSSATALLNQPVSVHIDDLGLVWIVDMRNEVIRRFDPVNGTVTRVAGLPPRWDTSRPECTSGENPPADCKLDACKGYQGDGGDALAACFNFPKNANPEPGGDFAFSPDYSKMYIADTENHVIRVLDLASGVIDLYAGAPGQTGNAVGEVSEARFWLPSDLAMDADGTLFVADSNNHQIKAIDTATGVVSVFAGTGEPTCPLRADVDPARAQLIPQVCDGQAQAGDGGLATDATLYRPFGVDFDLDGNVVISDTYNQRIRVVYR